jgi:Domain of unknown function (DUF4224)
MSTGIVLTQDEVEALTGRHRKDAQVKALRFMGIEHRVRPDGSIAVLKAHIELVLGGIAQPSTRQHRTQPNWAALDA